jgi:peptidyl-dipeptidase Dcp
MYTDFPAISLLSVALLTAACVGEQTDNKEAHSVMDNPLLAEWTGPYGGVPAFDKMNLEDLKPALEAGMAMHLEEIDAIANNPEPATFDNTIAAMERAGRDLKRVRNYFRLWRNNLSSPEYREIQSEMAPRLSEFDNKIKQNQTLFARIRAVYESKERGSLRPDQHRLAWVVYDDFARNGATLEGEEKDRFAAIVKRLAELHTQFAANILADEEGYVTYLDDSQLSGLSPSFIQAAATAATERDRDGQYAITNTRSSMDPFLKFSDERDLREKVWRTYYSRGDNGDEHDNNALISEILQLRHERVQLLGYSNYAEWRLENRMAKTPERAIELMELVFSAALERADEEVEEMQAIADAEDSGITIEPWDYRYYAEKVRRAKYALDSDEVKQYLQLSKLREAMFFVAGELFRFNFLPVPDGSVPVFHPDVRVWEVTDKDSGAHVGLWYLDPYARPGKRSGAWATTYRSHETFDGKRTVLASNNSNFVKGAPGEAELISWDDAKTLFHEFGHALHYFSSNVAYPKLNTGVKDYTEFQSQLLEHWLTTDEVIENYLVHHDTGEPMPADLVAKIKRASTFNSGFERTEYGASALVDMMYHTTIPTGIDPDAFEREAMAKLSMPKEIVMRHRSPHFGHIFSNENYSAAYYGYQWADVLTADAAEAFKEAPGGFYDQELAKKLVDNLFAPRNAIDPGDAYREFRGRDATTDAVMRAYGFSTP